LHQLLDPLGRRSPAQNLLDELDQLAAVHVAIGVGCEPRIREQRRFCAENLAKLGLKRENLEKVKTAEVGNIFNFGTERSKQMNVTFATDTDEQQPVFLGSYGIGITRVMGVIVEKLSDDKGIVWPENVAPAKVYLVRIGDEAATKQADELYDELTGKGIEVLYDDRDVRPGEKFADSELMGIPYRVTVSDRLMADNQYEFTTRISGETNLLTHDELLAKLS